MAAAARIAASFSATLALAAAGAGGTGAIGRLHANGAGVKGIFELCIIKSLDGAIQICGTEVVDEALAASVDISKRDISSLAHEVLQILPTAAARQARHDHTKISALASCFSSVTVSFSSAVSSPVSSTVSDSISVAAATTHLNSKACTVKHVSVTGSDGVLCVSVIIEHDEGEGRRAALVLDVDFSDASVPSTHKQWLDWPKNKCARDAP
jgi:hypothetical protein